GDPDAAGGRRVDTGGDEGVRLLPRADAALHPALARDWALRRRRPAPLVARRCRGGEHPRAGAGVRPARSAARDGAGRQRARVGGAVHGPAGQHERLRPRPGPAAELQRLPFPLRAADRPGRAAVAAGRLLRSVGAAAPPPEPAARVAAVDQRIGGDGAGLVEPGAGVLPGVGGEGQRRGL
ncbi:MAG: FIG01224662: hypothetical protein, partial [uncultured Sphingomonadaceae bacterium]